MHNHLAGPSFQKRVILSFISNVHAHTGMLNLSWLLKSILLYCIVQDRLRLVCVGVCVFRRERESVCVETLI